jgi:hypothetical protein
MGFDDCIALAKKMEASMLTSERDALLPIDTAAYANVPEVPELAGGGDLACAGGAVGGFAEGRDVDGVR